MTTTTTIPQAPLPPGADHAEAWELNDGTTRYFTGPGHSVGETRVWVWGEQAAFNGGVLCRQIAIDGPSIELGLVEAKELFERGLALVAEAMAYEEGQR
jgi:hypothetical protein